MVLEPFYYPEPDFGGRLPSLPSQRSPEQLEAAKLLHLPEFKEILRTYTNSFLDWAESYLAERGPDTQVPALTASELFSYEGRAEISEHVLSVHEGIRGLEFVEETECELWHSKNSDFNDTTRSFIQLFFDFARSEGIADIVLGEAEGALGTKQEAIDIRQKDGITGALPTNKRILCTTACIRLAQEDLAWLNKYWSHYAGGEQVALKHSENVRASLDATFWKRLPAIIDDATDTLADVLSVLSCATDSDQHARKLAMQLLGEQHEEGRSTMLYRLSMAPFGFWATFSTTGLFPLDIRIGAWTKNSSCDCAILESGVLHPNLLDFFTKTPHRAKYMSHGGCPAPQEIMQRFAHLFLKRFLYHFERINLVANA